MGLETYQSTARLRYQNRRKKGYKMKYGKSQHGVELMRDCFAEQFADPGDIKFNYIVKIYNEYFDEDQDTQALAKRLSRIADQLLITARFLKRIKPK